VYPALAVLQSQGSETDAILWVGGEGGMEAEIIERLNIPFTTIPAAGIHGVGFRNLPSNIIRLLRGVFASMKILSDFKPDVLLFTGGFVAVPMAVAGIRFPSLLYTPDIEPGLAIKAIARFSDCIALTADESKTYFGFHKNLIVSGYPTRPGLASMSREDSRQHFMLHDNKPVLLVFGGSKGAQTINQAILGILPNLLDHCQVLHITGKANLDAALQAKACLSENSSEYHPYPYLHDDMGAAFSAADLAVCRAGASTLGELPLFRLPAILIPYPYAWRYQKVNAEFLVKNGGAVLLKDEDMEQHLLKTILDLFQSGNRLADMRKQLAALARPQAAQTIAEALRDLVSTRKGLKA